jgi:hypothetical protein
VAVAESVKSDREKERSHQAMVREHWYGSICSEGGRTVNFGTNSTCSKTIFLVTTKDCFVFPLALDAG